MKKTKLETDALWVALSLTPLIGGKRLRLLLEHFDHDLQKIIDADDETLLKINGIGSKILESIRTVNPKAIQAQIKQWQTEQVQIITRRDKNYPKRLLQIHDEPATLFIKGEWTDTLLQNTVAIVGTRQPTEYSRQIAFWLGKFMADAGNTIISGLANGVDTYAHIGALSVENGKTIAVLGSGVLNVYPPENEQLAEKIVKSGALVSELDPNSHTMREWVRTRNRLISGLSDSLIVVETPEDGGAMVAAHHALEQGRTVYVVDNYASGNQRLKEHPDVFTIRFEED